MKYRGIPIEDITIFKHPLVYGDLFIKLLKDITVWVAKMIIKYIVYVLLISILLVSINMVSQLHMVRSFLIFVGYWIILGVASSIGLGTGLHTFVLYLGPHIAKVAIIATSCGVIPQMIPSRWNFDHFGTCSNPNNEHMGFQVSYQQFKYRASFGVLELHQVSFLLILWRKKYLIIDFQASETRLQLNKMNREEEKKRKDEQKERLLDTEDENILQIKQLKEKQNKTLMDRAKILIFDNLEKYGFITVLLCASIPNPLFDLAGITCGHFRIPFKTFFTATFIGKAIIKVHIQMLFIIAVFRKQSISWLLGLIAKISKSLSDTLINAMEKQKQVLHSPSSFSEDKPLIARLWDIFIILMVGYFLVSIINGQVQEKAIKIKDKN